MCYPIFIISITYLNAMIFHVCVRLNMYFTYGLASIGRLKEMMIL